MSKENIKDRLTLRIERETDRLKEEKEVHELREDLKKVKETRRSCRKQYPFLKKVGKVMSAWAERQRKENELQRLENKD